jgi:hypothetical protein
MPDGLSLHMPQMIGGGGGARGIALLFLTLSLMRVDCKHNAMAFFTPNIRHQSLFERVRKISPPPGFDPGTVRPVASRCTYYAIPS